MNIRPQNDAQKKVQSELNIAGALQQSANIESAKITKQDAKDKAEDEKAKRKEIREERNNIQERVKEAKTIFKEMCAAEILAWEEIDATCIGSPRSAKIKATLQAPLLGATHEAVAASRR